MMFGRCLVLGALLFFVAFDRPQAAEPVTYLSQWLQQPSLQFGATSLPTEALQRFYAAEGYQPVWVDANGLTPRAAAALDVIANADKDGLNPALYAISAIREIAAMPRSDAETAARVDTSIELLISQAVLSYAADMQTGAVSHQWDTGKPTMTADAQLSLLKEIAIADNPAAVLAGLAPSTPEYLALKNALQQYQTIAAHGGWPVFTPGKTIKPGSADPQITVARQILIAVGDLAADASPQGTYDSAMVQGVKHFQMRHGIDPSGTLDAATQAALAVPVEERITQIALNMERMRWMPQTLGSLGARSIVVNIPGYALTAVADGRRLSMNVIVGKPSTPTPMFSKKITDVIFNPSWNVPTKIAVNEMLPKLRKDPDYAAEKGYTVIAYSGGESHPVDPASVDWQSVGRGNMSYGFRQDPGDGNALGKVKFYIPDSDDIYLHDTSQHNLFSRADRSLSHGCVRVEDPKALAEFALGGEDWTIAKIDAAYDSTISRTVRITPIPVYLVYWTSWVDDAGRVHFNRDIYGMDRKLLAAMKAPRKQNTDLKLAANG